MPQIRQKPLTLQSKLVKIKAAKSKLQTLHSLDTQPGNGSTLMSGGNHMQPKLLSIQSHLLMRRP